MERTCSKSKQIIELVDGKLSRHERKTLETHIRQCSICRSFLKDFNQIDQVLTHHERRKPPVYLLKEYHQTLSRHFSPHSKPAGNSWILSFLFHPSPVMLFSQGAALLTAGVLIGWIVFNQPSDVSRLPATVVRISPNTSRQIRTFFHESEIWLLDMMNLPQNGDVAIQDWNMTYDQAEQLLRKINIIQEFNGSIADSRLQHYLNELEIMLLEMTNGGNEDHSGIVRQIRQTIVDLDLLFRVNMLKQRLPAASQQA